MLQDAKITPDHSMLVCSHRRSETGSKRIARTPITREEEGCAKTWELIKRAVKTHDSLPNKIRIWTISQLPYVHDERDRELAYGYNDATAREFMPTPRDHSNMLRAWSWLCWLRKQPYGIRDYRILVARARGYEWWAIADRCRKSDRTTMRYADGAIAAIYAKFDLEVWSMSI